MNRAPIKLFILTMFLALTLSCGGGGSSTSSSNEESQDQLTFDESKFE